jgi:capsular polysaccharide biosynthesis protein
MKNNQQNNYEVEIDLKSILPIFWRGKVLILFFSFLSIFLGSVYLHYVDREYTVEYKLKPVAETKQSNVLAGLGGLASLSGVQLPTNSTNDFKIFSELIYSVEVSEKIFKNNKLIEKIYENEWNSTQNIFSEPPKSKIIAYLSALKRILTGDKEVNYIPPDARRLAIYISRNISINEDKKTGFLTLRSETSKPGILLLLISEAIEASDQIMRQRYINFSKEPLAFYQEKLRISRSREHREALAELIGKEEEKLMFASKGKYFTAEPYIEPTTSLHPTAPKPLLILIFSLMLGLFFGAALVLLRHAIKKEN